MSHLVTLPCPVSGCPHSYQIAVTWEPGCAVPYGSTYAALPGSWETEVEEACPLHPALSLTDDQARDLDQAAVDAVSYDADDYDPREDREDVP